MLQFLCGIIVGSIFVLLVIYVLLFEPFGCVRTQSVFVEQFQPVRLPQELRQFLNENDAAGETMKWESCFNLSLILHFLFQEHKDTRRLRRWIQRKLQLELSDLTTRNAAGRLIQDIRIRDLSVGSKSPVIKAVRVESCDVSEEDESFKTLNLLVDVDYTGGFQTSVDVIMLFGRFAQLSIKLTRLSGKVRLKLTREPFTHWAFAFVDMPVLDFQIDSQWQGRQVKHLIPFITQQFRRVVQRKHVWPNYKIRYRPLFPNPLYQPSPPIGAFEYVKTTGVLEVTVLRCTRLNTALVCSENSEIFCVLSIDQRPLMQNASRSLTRCVTVLLNFSRHGIDEPIGMTFSKLISDAGRRSVQVSAVERRSSAEKCGFKPGDVVLAVNNVPVTSERQLSKLLSGPTGELNILIERTIYEEPKASLSTFREDDTASLSDFDEVTVPAVLKKIDSESVQKKVLKKGRRQRSQSVSTFSPSAALYDMVTDTFKDMGVFHSCAEGEMSSCSLKIPIENFDPVKVALIQTERNALLRKCVNIRRARSETEIARNHLWDNERMKNLVLTSSFENLLNIAHKGAERTLPNVAEDVSVTFTAGIVRHHNLDDLNTVVSAESPTKYFTRSPSRRERLQARAVEMAAAGKARVSDFWYRHRDTSSGAEVAVEALSQPDFTSIRSRSSSPMAGFEKKKRSSHSSRKRQSACQTDESDGLQKLPEASPRAVVTKSLRMSEDVLWGQSLHFDLNADSSKYLNVTVRAKRLNSNGAVVTAAQDSQITEYTASQMLGYASIYIPQLLDDCQLTLSNCHRELFTLRPPFSSATRRPVTTKAAAESRRAGFDERLCYGDIALGFRYFPDGLPTDVQHNFGAENVERVTDTAKSGSTNSLKKVLESKHNFETIMLKGITVCAVCRGKVWLKTASHCTACLLVCHNKCKSKVSTPCSHRPPVDDSKYEVLDGYDMDSNEEPNFVDDLGRNDHAVSELSSSAQAVAEERQLTRRRRIAVKVSERISSTWRSVGRKRASFRISKDDQNNEQTAPTVHIDPIDVVPVEKAIPDVFALLELSGGPNQMMYQPGNAYNEQMINAAKTAGKNMFGDLDPAKRKAKINGDMEKIQSIINQTAVERLDAMEVMKEKNTQDTGSVEFAQLDDRLQALAVLMLHYCAALQNCIDLEEGSECHDIHTDDTVQDSSTANNALMSEKRNTEDECAPGSA